MKKTAYFINTARGRSGRSAGAGRGAAAGLHGRRGAGVLYDSEPLAADDPLLQMDNVLLTPHIAGTTVDAIPRAPFLLMREVDRFLADGVTDRVVNQASITLE